MQLHLAPHAPEVWGAGESSKGEPKVDERRVQDVVGESARRHTLFETELLGRGEGLVDAPLGATQVARVELVTVANVAFPS